MTPNPGKMNIKCPGVLAGKGKAAFDKVVEWDRNLAKRFQDKFNLTDYQMLCISFAKGFIIGAILL